MTPDSSAAVAYAGLDSLFGVRWGAVAFPQAHHRNTKQLSKQRSGTMGTMDKRADLVGPGIGDYHELEKVLPEDYRSYRSERRAR